MSLCDFACATQFWYEELPAPPLDPAPGTLKPPVLPPIPGRPGIPSCCRSPEIGFGFDGAVIVCDNTQQFREAYREYFEFVDDPRNGLRTMTLPFDGGLEFTVRAG